MARFPFGPFSSIELYPLGDLDAGLDSFAKAMQQSMGSRGAPDVASMLQQLMGGAPS
jgi:hypothetical protein